MSDDPLILAGRYEVGALLGRGGMAEVHLATDRRLHRTVAVKILRSELARDDSFQERFRREAQSVGGLNHPAIVAVHDTGEEHTTDDRGHEISIPYIVMEYVKGKTLRELIHSDQPMDLRQAAEIMAGVLSALEYSHRMGIVHRDIKPGNIMITENGSVKVMDFGIARAVADATSAMTQTQAVMGTAQYLSPEQARGQLVDARSDIYSAACVLYEMLTGRPPFTGDSPVSIAYQHVRETPVPPSTYDPRIPPEMDAVVMTGLAKDRDERYPSAVAFSRDIAAVVAGREPQLVGGAPPAAPSDAESTTVLGAVGEGTEVLGASGATSMLPAPATTVLPTRTATGPQPVLGAAGGYGGPGAGSPLSAGSAETPGSSVATAKPSRPVWLYILIGLAVAALAGLLLFFLLPGSRDDAPQSVAVPDVVGQTRTEADSALRKAGLTPSYEQAADPDVEKGRVISTDPTASTQVDPGRSVKVIVSTGPEAISVPDLTGLTPDEARQKLTDQGLDLKLAVGGTENSKTQEKGKITRTDPPAGGSTAAGETITVWTSSGQVVVPNVVGLQEEAATTALKDAGLVADVSYIETADAEAGAVTSQTPPSDGSTTAADAGSTVQIVVASGDVTVPNVTGKSLEDAKSSLEDLGFGTTLSHENSDTVPAGQVIRTDPAANEKAARGKTITIVVSDGAAAPSPTPTPTPTTEAPETTPAPAPSESATEQPGG